LKPTSYNPLLHRLALLTAAATFPLIFLGGLVTSHGAGMAVPDWPNTWGYNMFAFPISKWVGGIFYEHTHRLYASGIGFLTIVLMVVAWLKDSRPFIRWTSVALFLAVLSQGIIGGLRVVLNDRDLAIVHGCFAQLFFCFAATFCVMTSPLIGSSFAMSQDEAKWIRRIIWMTGIAFAVVFGQLIVGAIMRHKGAGLAIPDFPTAYGGILPPTHIDNDFRQQAIHQFGPDLGLNRVTLFQIWIHFAHRIGAVLVSVAILTLCITIFAKLRRLRMISIPAALLILFLATQITLGILTVLWRKPADIASLHVAVGSLILMTTWVIGVRLFALSKVGPAHTNVQSDPLELTAVQP
jgi:cytochrome c oxidase assembly protein subunit 15